MLSRFWLVTNITIRVVHHPDTVQIVGERRVVSSELGDGRSLRPGYRYQGFSSRKGVVGPRSRRRTSGEGTWVTVSLLRWLIC